MDLSSNLADVASVLQIGEFLWNTAKWSRGRLGREMRGAVERSVDRACQAVGILAPELDERSGRLARAVWKYVRARGLSPSFLLGLEDVNAWEAGLLGTLETEVTLSEASEMLEVLRREMLGEVVALVPAESATDVADRLHAAEGSETLLLVRETLRHAERMDDVVAALRRLERSIPVRAGASPRTAARLRPPQVGHSVVGRDEELEMLRSSLVAGRDRPRLILISGVSGIGKTALVADLWRLEGPAYEEAWWVDGSSDQALVADLCAIGACLDLPDPFAEPRVTISRLRVALEAQGSQFLLVVDDLVPDTDSSILRLAWGHIVVTAQGTPIHGDVSVSLTGISSSAATTLAQELSDSVDIAVDDLPTFGDGTYSPMTVREAAIALRSGSVPSDPGAQRFALSMDRIRRTSGPAWRVLELLAVGPAAPMDLTTLLSSRTLRAHLDIAGGIEDGSVALALLRPLIEHSVIPPCSPQAVPLHDALRGKLLASMSHGAGARAWDALASALLELLPDDARQSERELFVPWLAAVDHLVASATTYHSPRDVLLVGRLALRAGLLHNALAQRDIARQRLEVARTHLRGLGGAEVVVCEVELARCERHAGDLERALERLLSVASLPSGRSPADGAVLIAVARVLGDMNAFRLSSLVARGAARQLGPATGHHDDYAMALSMLGRAQVAAGDPGAKQSFEIARTVMREHHDENSAIHAWSLDDLASAYAASGDHREAHRLFTDALGAETELTGLDHPRRAWTLVNLASVSGSLHGSERAAHALLEEGLSLQRRAVTRENPDLQRFEVVASRFSRSTPLPLQAAHTNWKKHPAPSVLRGLATRVGARAKSERTK